VSGTGQQGPSMRLCLVTGASGLHKKEAIARLKGFLSGLTIQGRDVKVGVAEVEEELAAICPAEDYQADDSRDPLVSIIGQIPSNRIRELWPKAFRQALQKAACGAPDLAILVACLCYYRDQTYEFYCPVDFGALRSKDVPTFHSVLTLFDDIYDVYQRLSQPAHVFDIGRLVQYEATDQHASRSERYRTALGIVIQSLIRILEWRENEIHAAEALAATLDVPARALATKHPTETAVRLILGEASPEFAMWHTFPIYLSHPISLPRKKLAETGSWPSFVNEYSEFVASLRADSDGDWHLAPVMPTSIDEYRIATDARRLLPALTPRWPLPQNDGGSEGGLLYSAATAERYDANVEPRLGEQFDPPLDRAGGRARMPGKHERTTGMLMGDSEVSGMLKTLQSVITLQMANRDHLLVRQCPGLLLYRPTYDEEPRFTSGVLAEIRDHHLLRKFDRNQRQAGRPMVVIHSCSDLKRIFAPDTKFTRTAARNICGWAEEYLRSHEHAPGELPPEVLSVAFSAPGDPAEHLPAIHRELFLATAGSIGRAEAAPVGSSATEQLRAFLLEERVVQLCSRRPSEGWSWRYLHVDTEGQEAFSESSATEPALILVLVVADLESSDAQRVTAARLARQHFARCAAHAPEACEQAG